MRLYLVRVEGLVPASLITIEQAENADEAADIALEGFHKEHPEAQRVDIDVEPHKDNEE